MLTDHQNLLSTFGKDSQSSNRNSRQKQYNFKSKKMALIYEVQPQSRYQQILNRRRTLMMLQKQQQFNDKHKNPSKKLRTQSDIDYLNTCIRKSISGIAQTIGKSKITKPHHHLTSLCSQFGQTHTSVSKLSKLTKQSIQSHKVLKTNITDLNKYVKNNQIKNPKANDIKKRKFSMNDKENHDYNYFNQSKRNYNNLNKNQYLKNSTKKKTNLFDNQEKCRIKSSFSIDLNSQKSSRLQQSIKQASCSSYNYLRSNSNRHLQNTTISNKYLPNNSSDRYYINPSNLNNIFTQDNNIRKEDYKKPQYKKGYPELKIQQLMEETLKKQLKMLSQSNYGDQPRLLQTRGNKNTKSKQQFLFYQEHQNNRLSNPRQFSHIEKNLEIEQSNSLRGEKKFYKQQRTVYQQQSHSFLQRNHHHHKQNHPKTNLQQHSPQQTHKLIKSFMQQIQLDYDLRHAKHMFSGIEQPFHLNSNPRIQQSKWQKLNKQLQHIGLSYSVDTIKKIFLPSQQQIDPFLSVPQPHQQLVYSLIYAYESAQKHWQQTIYQKWQHWDLRDIQLTIQNIDRDRKGYITVEDLAAFISMQTGRQYKNRDLVLIYKRLVNGFQSRNKRQEDKADKEQKKKLKFRVLIDCLIKPFTNTKPHQKRS